MPAIPCRYFIGFFCRIIKDSLITRVKRESTADTVLSSQPMGRECIGYRALQELGEGYPRIPYLIPSLCLPSCFSLSFPVSLTPITQNEAEVSVGVYGGDELSFKLLGKDFASMVNLELAIGVGTLEPVAGAG